MASRNITLSIPEEIVRKAKVLAAQRDTSVSALVTELLEHLTGDPVSYDEAWADEERLMAAGIGMRVGTIDWDRAALHDR